MPKYIWIVDIHNDSFAFDSENDQSAREKIAPMLGEELCIDGQLHRGGDTVDITGLSGNPDLT